jgi:hypothetical protein
VPNQLETPYDLAKYLISIFNFPPKWEIYKKTTRIAKNNCG